MTSVWAELKRRNVAKVAVAYGIVGWLLVQVADTFFPALQLPEWTVTFVAGLVILGFPIALILSWAYELTPEGMKRSHDVPATESVTYVTGRKIDFAIIGTLLVALGFVVVDKYVLERGSDIVPGVLTNSVAVLPFANLSTDPENAFFAAGIHDTILNELVKIADISVIARTSVLRYADEQTPIAQIAEELNVETVMEGTVQYAGDQVRITAQLIDPGTGAQLWSGNYDRPLADIFEVQTDIAVNIANALEAQFSDAEQLRVGKAPTSDSTAYAFYLRALSTQNQGSADYFIAINQAIASDPDFFALAYASRAVNSTFELVGVGVGSTPEEVLELERRVNDDAERALSIDPTLGVAHAAQAVVHQANWRGTAAEQAFRRAIQLSPNDVYVLLLYGRFKRYRGEYDEAVSLVRRASQLDPNDYSLHAQLAFIYRDAADWDAAIDEMRIALTQNPANLAWNINLGYIEAARGNGAEAVRILRLAEQLDPPPLFRLAQIAHAYALAGRLDDAKRIFSDFEERATEEGVSNARWAQAYIAVGDYAQALRRIESAVNERVSLDQAPLSFLAANPSRNPELNKREFRTLLDNLWDDG